VFNGDQTIERTLRSAQHQTYPNFEIVVCDNASTDRTESIVREYAAGDARIRYYRNEHNLGATKNFRNCLDLAAGKYFAWLGADDYYEPEFLRSTVRELEADSTVVGAISDVEIVDATGSRLAIQWFESCRPKVSDRLNRAAFFNYPSNLFMFICAVFRRDVLCSVDTAPRTWKGMLGGREHPVLASLAARGRLVAIPDVLMKYTYLAGSSWRTEHSDRQTVDFALQNVLIATHMSRAAIGSGLPLLESLNLAVRPWLVVGAYARLAREKILGSSVERPTDWQSHM
jgi:glycosyltransferase involved in cell wall biosynthesis